MTRPSSNSFRAKKRLTALQDKSGLADVLATLGSNPLPDSYVLKLAGSRTVAEAARMDDTGGRTSRPCRASKMCKSTPPG